MPGPIGKRDAERRRRNKPVVETETVDIAALISQPTEIPVPPEPYEDDEGEIHDGHCWHPIAENAYRSLARSGQAIFMEPSDWATAYVMCETISRELNPKPIVVQTGENESEIQWVRQPLNGAVLSAFLKGWASLMATEGDRRRLKIELEREKAKAAIDESGGQVVSIVKNRNELFG